METAERLEVSTPEGWRWKGKTVKLIDGTTLTMPDTPANQQAYPQSPSQKPGLGFPNLRLLLVFALATGMVADAAYGPYAGKETGETALLRQILDHFQPGEVLVGDR